MISQCTIDFLSSYTQVIMSNTSRRKRKKLRISICKQNRKDKHIQVFGGKQLWLLTANVLLYEAVRSLCETAKLWLQVFECEFSLMDFRGMLIAEDGYDGWKWPLTWEEPLDLLPSSLLALLSVTVAPYAPVWPSFFGAKRNGSALSFFVLAKRPFKLQSLSQLPLITQSFAY